VQHIRDNGEIECTISNLNMGMSRQCVAKEPSQSTRLDSFPKQEEDPNIESN
jgi:hypothetical protein